MFQFSTLLSYQLPSRIEKYFRLQAFSKPSGKFLSKISQIYGTTSNTQENPSFWSKGLKFSCTGCGKCCQTEGWLVKTFYLGSI